MKKTPIMLIKMGGSLITYKKDPHRIEQYLDKIDQFNSGKTSFLELTKTISNLINHQHLNDVFQVIKSFLDLNPNCKIVLIHGAGSVGHALVLHLNERGTLEDSYSLIKLAVSIQNQIVISTAIKNGINAVSFPSHPILKGTITNGLSSIKADSPDLTVFEQVIINCDAVPVFFGDVGFTPTNWKVLSGDVIPTALMRRSNRVSFERAIFLTNVEGKQTGIYSEDPSSEKAEFISRIEVNTQEMNCYSSNGKLLALKTGQDSRDFDVTETMGGKLRNLFDLARNHVKCWVVGIEDFKSALAGDNVGTTIVSKNSPIMNIVFLGIGDAFGSGGHRFTSTLIETENHGILLDCGPHTIQALKRSGRSTNEIDIVLITHFHGDHFGGVPFLLLEASIQQQRSKPLFIIGPPNIKTRVQNIYSELYENIANNEMSFLCEYRTLIPSQQLNLFDFQINAFQMLHTPEAQGYRIEINGVTLAYSGDSGWTENLIPLVSDAHLAIVECNFLDTEIKIHLNYHQAKKLSSYTNRLALIHLGPECLNKEQLLEEEDNIFIPLEGQELKL